MARKVLCLELIFAAGGHGHLEQPTNSMAWLDHLYNDYTILCPFSWLIFLLVLTIVTGTKAGFLHVHTQL